MGWKLLGKFRYDGFEFRVWDSGMVSFGTVTCGIGCLVGTAKTKALAIANS